MNIPGIRLIVPLLCGLLFVAVAGSKAEEPKSLPNSFKSRRVTETLQPLGQQRANANALSATPTPSPQKPGTTVKSSKSNSSDRATTVSGSRSNGDARTANPKASPTPKPNEATTLNSSRNNGSFRMAASPTPAPKAK